MSWQLIYWLTRLTALKVSLGIMLGVPAVVLLTQFFWFAIEERQMPRRSVIWLAIFSVLFLVSVTFIPSTKEACAIYLIPKIANNEDVQKIPANVAKILNAQLEEWIDEQFGEVSHDPATDR